MPITLVATDPALRCRHPLRAATATAARALDLGRLASSATRFAGRAPEVKWVLPPELRKIARRAPGIVDDPDQMGQAMLRSPKLHGRSRSAPGVAPEPHGGGRRPRSSWCPRRSASAARPTAGCAPSSRWWPADARNGQVLWRSVPLGTGADARRGAGRGPHGGAAADVASQ